MRASADAIETIDLPPPRAAGDHSLEEALARRGSVREFRRDRLPLEELSQLLWATQGVTRPWGARTAPSAGALYPLELYVVTPSGLYRYCPPEHRLEILSEGRDLRPALARAALGQSAVEEAAAILVVTGVPARTAAEYGARAERYVALEAGHACQNALLQAVALGLGAVPIGAFLDDRVSGALELTSEQVPLYLIPVGRPARAP
jgi:SagB-type dehydrogenase family enzyme